MTQAQALEELQALFDIVFVTKVSVTPDLHAGLIDEWTSLAQIRLVIAIEEHFNIRFRMGEVAKLKTVGELADLICAYKKAR